MSDFWHGIPSQPDKPRCRWCAEAAEEDCPDHGLRAKELAIEAVGRDRAAMSIMLAAIKRCATARVDFTTDDIRTFADALPTEGRAWGAAIRHAADRGIIRSAGTYRPSTEPASHGRPKLVWRSLIHERSPGR